MTWRVQTVDYTRHIPGVGMTKPVPVITDYATESEARADLELFRALAAASGREVVGCVSEIGVRVKRKRGKAMGPPHMDLPIQRKRLT